MSFHARKTVVMREVVRACAPTERLDETYGSDVRICVTGLGRPKSFSFSQPSRAKGMTESPEPSSAMPSERMDPPTTNAYRESCPFS